MQRLAVALILVAIAVALVAVVSRGLVKVFRTDMGAQGNFAGDLMPKIAFFLLLCLMAYAIMTGAS